jgi:hypothetical protein
VMWSVAENDRYALTEGQVLRASKNAATPR